MGSREVSVGISGRFGVRGGLGSWGCVWGVCVCVVCVCVCVWGGGGGGVAGSGTRARSAASVLLRGLSWGLQGASEFGVWYYSSSGPALRRRLLWSVSSGLVSYTRLRARYDDDFTIIALGRPSVGALPTLWQFVNIDECYWSQVSVCRLRPEQYRWWVFNLFTRYLCWLSVVLYHKQTR